jgi:hypothetical protein
MGVHPPPSPARANFTLITECTPESSGCNSVYSVSLLETVDGGHTMWVYARKWAGICAETGYPLKLPSPTKLARRGHFPPAARRAALPAWCFMYMSFLCCKPSLNGPWNLLSLLHKITNVPVVYMGAGVWIWMGVIHFSGRLKGWALKSRLFWAQIALATLVPITGPTPSKASRYGLLPHQNPYVPPHTNNRYC